MKLSPLKQLLIASGVVIAVGILFVSTAKKPTTQLASGVTKSKEVIGIVASGPQIVTRSPLIGYAVYVEKEGMVALRADQCPSLGNGQRVVMHSKGGPSNWYTFLRYAQ